MQFQWHIEARFAQTALCSSQLFNDLLLFVGSEMKLKTTMRRLMDFPLGTCPNGQ